MEQRDYILRLIEQLGAVMAALRRRILGAAPPEGLRGQLDGVASRAGFDLELLRGFDLQTLRLLVAPTGDVDPTRCWLMAEILYLDGLEALLSEDPEGRDSLLKARALFELVRPHGGLLVGLPEADERIEEIDERLAEEGSLGRIHRGR
jgi:hypothetical protein